MNRKLPSLVLVIALAGALAACASNPSATGRLNLAVETPASEIEAIAALLDQGETDKARERLNTALRGDPLNPSLLVLQQGIEGDAKEDLGPASYAYTVTSGETFASIAQRALGNRLKSYQLARYNEIDDPRSLLPGQVIRIPGQSPRGDAPSSRGAEPKGPPPPTRAERASPPAPTRPPPTQPTATARKVDGAEAQRARTAGLAALNKGEISKAVAMLERASALNPSNDAIRKELARARRIASTVRSRR